MPLKPYSQLVQLDIKEHCETRKAKDDSGKQVDIPYLNWAKCKELLHENGADTVYYTPLTDANGSFVFCSKEVQNKDGRKTGCYFVAVEVHIDDLVFRMDMPLMNGSLVVYEDTLNQLRIANCHARAFVKGVAIHTGLGFSLWSSDKDTDTASDDLSGHSIHAIKERINRLMTIKLQNGMAMDDVLSALNMNKRQLKEIVDSFDKIAGLESSLKKL